MSGARGVVVAGLALAAVCGGLAFGEACPNAGPGEAARLAAYVAKKYRLPAGAQVRVERVEAVGDACYHRVTFLGEGPLGSYRLVLYASPDFRFLSSDMLDTRRDPGEEEREAARRAMGEMLEGEYAARGSADAAVTVVVFSDFQCPYCKRLEGLLAAEPMLMPGGRARLVYRHMPLEQHEWALKAAEAAACAGFQSAGAFWAMHDGLFAGQGQLTVGNLDGRVREMAAGIQGLDAVAFGECMGRQMSLGAVVRDRELGRRLGVDGTPAVFVNGRRVDGIRDGAGLHGALVEACGAAGRCGWSAQSLLGGGMENANSVAAH